MHPGAEQGYVHVAVAINCNSSSSMSHGPQGSTPWLGPAAFASPSLPSPTHTQPNTTTFPLEGNTEKLSWLRQTCSQRQGEAGQPRAGVGAPEARGVGAGGQLSALPGTRTPCGCWCPHPCGPLGPPGGETGGHPKGPVLPRPSHPFHQAGRGAGTYRAEPAWPAAWGGAGLAPRGTAWGWCGVWLAQRGAGTEAHAGGRRWGHSPGTQLVFEGAAPPSRGSCEWGR